MTKTDLKDAPLPEWEVTADGWCAGAWRKKGETLQLSEIAARYENVTPAAPARAEKEPAKK